MSHGSDSSVHQLLSYSGIMSFPPFLYQRRKNSSSETGPSHISCVLDHLLHYIIVHYVEASLHILLTCAVVLSACAAFGQRECSSLCYFSLFHNDKVMHLIASLIKWTSPPYFLCRTEARTESGLNNITAIYLNSQFGQTLHLHSFSPLGWRTLCDIRLTYVVQNGFISGTESLENRWCSTSLLAVLYVPLSGVLATRCSVLELVQGRNFKSCWPIMKCEISRKISHKLQSRIEILAHLKGSQ